MLNFSDIASESGLPIEENVPLAPFTTWKIGGKARYFARIKNRGQLAAALGAAHASGIPMAVMAGGSNVLVSDSGFDGLVLKMEMDWIEFSGTRVRAGAGVAMGRLAALCMQRNLKGLEWAVGIPGTVGGAIFGNSNCFGGSTGGCLAGAELADSAGNFKNVDKSYFRFGYDFSSIQETREILIEALFDLSEASIEDMARIRQGIAKMAAERSATQPLGQLCAGSTFKAVPQTRAAAKYLDSSLPDWRSGIRDGCISAGYIIDRGLSLKGYRIGQMQVSPLHANFFINLGGASAKNAKELIDFVKKKCQNKFGIELEEEVRFIGEIK